MQAPDERNVALRACGLQPSFKLSAVIGPMDALPAVIRRRPFRKMIENERTEYRAAASVKLRPPIPRQRRQQRVAAEPFEIVAKAQIVGLALEQLLDRSAQLLVVHLGRPLQPQGRRAV